MNLEIMKKLGLEEVTIDAGIALLKQDERASKVYIMVTGKVRVTAKDHEIAVIDDIGTILGEISALLGTDNVATVTTMEPSTFHIVDDFLEFIKENPEVGISVAQLLAVRLINTNNHMVYIKDQLDGLQTNLKNYLPVFSETGIPRI